MQMNNEIIIATIAAVSSIASILVKSGIDHYLAQKEHKTKLNNRGVLKLKYHDLFVKMHTWINYFETSFHLDNSGKDEVFKEILIRKFEIWQEELLILADKVNECITTCDHKDCNKLYRLNMQAFDNATLRFAQFPKLGNYTAEERKCIEIAVDKFSKWHTHRIQYVMGEIERKCNSQMHDDCYIKQVAIFDSYISAFSDTMFDAEQTLNEMNGDLNGFTFRGKLIDSHK